MDKKFQFYSLDNNINIQIQHTITLFGLYMSWLSDKMQLNPARATIKLSPTNDLVLTEKPNQPYFRSKKCNINSV